MAAGAAAGGKAAAPRPRARAAAEPPKTADLGAAKGVRLPWLPREDGALRSYRVCSLI